MGPEPKVQRAERKGPRPPKDPSWGPKEATIGYALLGVALTVGVVLFEYRGSLGPLRPGLRIERAVTLVTADRDGLACASAESVDGYACAFDGNHQPRPPGARGTLAPAMSVHRELFFIANLFQEPTVKKRYESEPPGQRRPEELRRFEADCRFDVLGKMKARNRWGANNVWEADTTAWALVPVDCRVHDGP